MPTTHSPLPTTTTLPRPQKLSEEEAAAQQQQLAQTASQGASAWNAAGGPPGPAPCCACQCAALGLRPGALPGLGVAQRASGPARCPTCLCAAGTFEERSLSLAFVQEQLGQLLGQLRHSQGGVEVALGEVTSCRWAGEG